MILLLSYAAIAALLIACWAWQMATQLDEFLGKQDSDKPRRGTE